MSLSKTTRAFAIAISILGVRRLTEQGEWIQ
jgi:hypothetical protein